jgi:hypothetical protein
MIRQLYYRYLAHDRPLRHYTQHLLVAFIAYLFFIGISKISFIPKYFFLFMITSYLVDLDGFISLFLSSKHIPEARQIVQNIYSLNFSNAATLATVNHKKFNHLIIHNLYGFLLVFTSLSFSLIFNNQIGTLISFAMLSHFTFDILDDLYQLGHVRNWLWPIRNL